jgi:uncharacterized Zn finger protein
MIMDKIQISCPHCETSIYISKEVLETDNYIQCYICSYIFKNNLKD